MSGVKHTPGPWIAEYVPDLRATLIGTADHQTAFARMDTHNGEPDAETQEANARLIAAAPDLLEALESLVEHTDGISLPVTAHMMRNRARDTIARARGEQDGGGA